MQNHKFGNVLDAENYWKNSLCSHLEQIVRKYPDYEPNEYIIWIDSSIFLPVQWRTMSATILLKNAAGTIIRRLLTTEDFKVGKPFPNKALHQMRLKNGRGSIFGIPLRFKTFAELGEIKHIDIMWEIGFEIKHEIYNSLTSIRYDVDFVPDKHKRIYTITEHAVCNIVSGWNIKEDMEFCKRWWQEFDNVVNNVFKHDEQLSDEQIEIISRNKINEIYRADVSWLITECTSQIKLVSTDFSSILDEPSFGFKQIKEENFHDYQKFIDYHEEYYKHKWCGKE